MFFLSLCFFGARARVGVCVCMRMCGAFPRFCPDCKYNVVQAHDILMGKMDLEGSENEEEFDEVCVCMCRVCSRRCVPCVCVAWRYCPGEFCSIADHRIYKVVGIASQGMSQRV